MWTMVPVHSAPTSRLRVGNPLLFISFPALSFSGPGSDSFSFLDFFSVRRRADGASPFVQFARPTSTPRNSFRINTYRISISNSFRMNTYRKRGGGYPY